MSTVDYGPLADTAGLGQPIAGPRAYTGELTRFWHLTFNIAKTQWKMRFFGSLLGYLWQLIRPLMLFGVLYVFFTMIAHVNQTEPSGPGQPGQFYGAQLLGAIVLFTFFSEATMGAVRGVVDNETLVRKIQFPRLAIPLATVLVSLFNVTLNLLVVMLFAVITGVRPMLSWLEIPLILIWLAMFGAGFAMLLSAMFVYFRDISPIWEVVLQVLFYASSVMLPLYLVAKEFHTAHVAPWVLKLYVCNPLVVALEQFKHAVINHASPGPSLYVGHLFLLVPTAFVLFILVLGYYVFNRTAPYVAENI